MAAKGIAAQAMRDAGFDDAKTAAIRGILAAALDIAGHEAASKLTEQRQGMEALLLQMGQQQTDIANNMRAMQAERNSTKSIMEQFQQEGTAMKDTMRNQSVGIQQMEVRMEALNIAEEGIPAESDQMEGLIAKLTEASSSAFNALQQGRGPVRRGAQGGRGARREVEVH